MYQVKSAILHFFLLILRVLFNLVLDAIYKYGGFSKALLEKSLEFVLGDKINPGLFF